MTISERIEAARRERRVLTRVCRAAWRLEQAERERTWALVSARAEGISIRTLATAAGGGAVVLDVAQLEALLTRTFSIGLDVSRGREKVALVRLRLSRALPGAAGTQAMAAGALAIERGVAMEQIAAAGGLALHAAAFNGMPDPVLHLAARAMGAVTGLAALEPDPRAPRRRRAPGRRPAGRHRPAAAPDLPA